MGEQNWQYLGSDGVKMEKVSLLYIGYGLVQNKPKRRSYVGICRLPSSSHGLQLSLASKTFQGAAGNICDWKL